MDHPSRSQAFAAKMVPSCSGFYFRNFVCFSGERHCVPGHGAIRVEAGAPIRDPGLAVPFGSGYRFEHRQRGHDYRKSAEHADWLLFPHPLSGLPGAPWPHRAGRTVLRVACVVSDFSQTAGHPRGSGGLELPEVPLPVLWKPVLVATGVVIGFLVGAPPALVSALGAAVLLISRTTDSHRLYGEVDWGLLVFFIGLFLIVGGAENAGIVARFLLAARSVNLHSPAAFIVVTTLLSNVVSNVPAVMLLKSFV